MQGLGMYNLGSQGEQILSTKDIKSTLVRGQWHLVEKFNDYCSLAEFSQLPEDSETSCHKTGFCEVNQNY